MVILTVDEGKSLLFGTLNITGNDNLSNEAIRELLTKVTRERHGLKTDAAEVPYVGGDVREGIRAIHHIYELLGYSDALVELAGTEIDNESGTVDVNVTVKEGTLVKVGDLELPTAITSEVEKVYSEVRIEFADKPYTSAVSANLADRIATAAREAGYFDAVVEVDAQSPKPVNSDSGDSYDAVDLSITAAWGELYTLGDIKVSGTEKIKDGVIDKRFKHLLSEPFSPTRTNKAVEDLLETGAFDALSTTPVPNEDGTISLDVAIEEAKRRRLAVYGGFSTYEGPILGLEYRNSNFLSRLHSFEANVEYNNRGIRGEVEHTNPWLFNSDWASQFSLYSRTQNHEGYEILDFGAHYGLYRKFGKNRNQQILLLVKPEYSEITDFDIEEQFLGPKDYFLTRLGIIYSYGRKKDRIAGKKGFFADVILSGTSPSIGSDVGFGRAAIRASYLLPIGKTKLRLGARAGIIKPTDDEDLPIDLRFFTGWAAFRPELPRA